jgi:predicted RNA-binding protein
MVQYRSLKRGDARLIRQALKDGGSIDLNSLGEVIGEGEWLSLESIEVIASEGARLVTSGENPEGVEHLLSGEIYLALRDVPVDVRDDAGFWRWVTLGPLLQFTVAREENLGIEALGVGTNMSDILGCRMFLRGQVARIELGDNGSDFSLASAPGTKTHDFWQSHILRRTTGAETEFAQALIMRQADEESKLGTEELRKFVRDSINRKKRTVATFLMSRDEASAYLEGEATLGDVARSVVDAE